MPTAFMLTNRMLLLMHTVDIMDTIISTWVCGKSRESRTGPLCVTIIVPFNGPNDSDIRMWCSAVEQIRNTSRYPVPMLQYILDLEMGAQKGGSATCLDIVASRPCDLFSVATLKTLLVQSRKQYPGSASCVLGSLGAATA